MKRRLVYFDNNSTTRVNKIVAEEVYKYMRKLYGNPSCAHDLGMLSDIALMKSRNIISEFLNVTPDSIYFCSGATEANNLIIKGFLMPYLLEKKNVHAITSKIEHPSVLNCFEELKKYFENLQVDYIDVDEDGRVVLDDFKKAIRSETMFVSIMAANNETGILQPIEIISEICKRNSIVFHTDATQLFGKYPELLIKRIVHNIDMISMSGHKIHGPKGVGAFYLSNEFPGGLFNLMSGGGQQNNVRSGTENVPGIVGLGKAVEIIKTYKDPQYELLQDYRDLLRKNITSICRENNIDIVLNTTGQSLVNTLNFSIPKSLEKKLTLVEFFNKKGICLTAGSACSSKKPVESYVLKSMRRSTEEASSSVRISLSHYNTFDEIQYFLKIFRSYITYLKKGK